VTRSSPSSSRPGPPATRASVRASTATSKGRPDGSYTVELLDDPPRIGAKLREEADEAARAADSESDGRLADEAADVLYHLLVMLRSRDLGLDAVEEALNDRRR
jgi:phosphoribosyl-AMP cyclohydrolase / phosphoribosyl-ATP pyrophosphohydrolase